MNISKLSGLSKGELGPFLEEYLTGVDRNNTDLFNSESKNAVSMYNSLRSKTGKIGEDIASGSKYGASTRGSGFVDRLISTQIRPEAGEAGEFKSIQKGLGIFFDPAGKFRGWKGMIKEMGGLFKDEIELHLQQQNDLLNDISKNTGIVGKLSKEFREEIMAASPAAEKIGISFQELRESVSGLVGESGKFKLLSRETIEEMELASVFTEDMIAFSKMGKDFEAVGVGVRDMSRIIDKAGHSALEVGLNAKMSTKLIDENLNRINSYGFKNGIEGLGAMTRKSVEFRMNMSDAFTFADKVWDPDKALELVANLQVLGGAYGDLNDPLKLMYMATNNVEGLQDALINASKTLVTFNKEQGRFEVTGVNLRRAKEMADQFGMSMQELTTTAVAAMERSRAATDLLSTGLIIDDKDREFLTNLAQMKGGKMVIEVPPDLRKQMGVSADNTAIALESMTDEQAKTLLEQRKAFEKMTTEQYARQQVSILQNIDRDVSFIRATLRVGIGQVMGEALEEFVGIDKTKIIEESAKIRDIMGGKMGELQTSVVDWMHEKGMSGAKIKPEAIDQSRKEGISGAMTKGTIKGGEIASAPVPEYLLREKMELTKETPEKITRSYVTVVHKSGDVIMDPITRMLNMKEILDHPDQFTGRNPGGQFGEGE